MSTFELSLLAVRRTGRLLAVDPVPLIGPVPAGVPLDTSRR
jgi:hypothetical protein